MVPRNPTALIADDEPLLRRALERMLGRVWPELTIIAQARNGRQAVSLFEKEQPDVCFLDVHMPGLSGIEAARNIGDRAYVVFVTAHDQYAVQAFEQRALDYLVKPLEETRLSETVSRLKKRMLAEEPVSGTESLLDQLAEQLEKRKEATPLRWIRVSVGPTLKLISVDDIDFLRSEDKYTLIACRDDSGKPVEAIVRTPLKNLVEQLDQEQFVQVHRSAAVNLGAVHEIIRKPNETAEIRLKGREDVLPVSRNFLQVFRQM